MGGHLKIGDGVPLGNLPRSLVRDGQVSVEAPQAGLQRAQSGERRSGYEWRGSKWGTGESKPHKQTCNVWGLVSTEGDEWVKGTIVAVDESTSHRAANPQTLAFCET